ncbi:MAG TPA: hypothetical protein VF752_10230 [Thermoleophilaceae bacterium]
MTRRAAGLAAPLAAAALAFAGCGGDGVDNAKHGIPQSDAQAILTQLDQIGSQFDNKACNGASAKVRELQTRVDGLPRSVDADLRRELVNGVRHLDQLVADQCQRPEPTQTETTTTPSETTPPPTTETTPTETQPPPTQTEPPPTTTTPTPTTPGTGGTAPGSGNGGDNSNGTGQGGTGD